MDAYIYCADIYCEDCGRKMRADLDAKGAAPEDPADESSYDSDDYPKGPYSDGGGESDSVQHCANCQCCLDNPLTDQGIDYTADALWQYVTTGGKRGAREVLDQWADLLQDHELDDAPSTKLAAYRLYTRKSA